MFKSGQRLALTMVAVCVSSTAFSAPYLGRILSRANCATFNESVTWDPRGTGHSAYVESHQRDRASGRVDVLRSPNPYGSSWRHYAGRNVMSSNFTVQGKHWERLDNNSQVSFRTTAATSCNITDW